MKNKDDGGTVFPVQQNVSFSTGITLRDWFAGQVVAGMWVGRESDFLKIEQPTAANVADSAYKIADAMLEVRKK